MNRLALINVVLILFLLSYGSALAQMAERYTKAELNDLIEYCNDEMDKHPQDIRYKLSRAEAYFLLEEYDNSLKDYLDIYKLDNKNVQVTNAIAIIYNHKNLFSNSIKFYNITITNSPREIDAFYGRGTSYLEMKKYDLAIKDLSYCIELNPNYFS